MVNNVFWKLMQLLPLMFFYCAVDKNWWQQQTWEYHQRKFSTFSTCFQLLVSKMHWIQSSGLRWCSDALMRIMIMDFQDPQSVLKFHYSFTLTNWWKLATLVATAAMGQTDRSKADISTIDLSGQHQGRSSVFPKDTTGYSCRGRNQTHNFWVADRQLYHRAIAADQYVI